MAQTMKCLLWMDSARSPFVNMAADELLLEECHRLDNVILRIYGWDRPSASFGYSQSPEAVTRKGLVLVRRPTGGGVVYHDCDMTYTLAIPHSNPILLLDRVESYRVVHEPIMNAVKMLGKGAHLADESVEKHDRATLQCFVSPSPNDVIAADGAKLAGAAQRRTRKGILHQGSISLKASPDNTAEPIIRAVISAFEKELSFEMIPFTPDDSFIQNAEQLALKKYATDSWNINKVEG